MINFDDVMLDHGLPFSNDKNTLPGEKPIEHSKKEVKI